jgi:hypothetical protein
MIASTFDLTQVIEETGGASIFFEGKPSRYVVGDSRYGSVDPDPTQALRIQNHIIEVLDRAITNGIDLEGIGFWRDDKGMLHVDPIITYNDLDVALDVAKHNGEMSIWDSQEQQVIWVI